MARAGFVMFKKYGGSGGGSHLAHDLRKKTRRELRGDIKKIGDWDSVMKNIKEIKPLRKSQKVDYLEVVTYPDNEAQAEAILKYLQQLLHRPVAGVWHFDESHPHVHYVIAWRDETGRALRLNKSQLKKMQNDIARMQGKEMTPKGQGRRKIPAHVWFTAPNYYKASAHLESENIKKAREGIKQVLNVYKQIRISLLRRGVGKIDWLGRVELRNGVITLIPDNPKKQPFPLPIRRLYDINAYGGDEIVFKPARFYRIEEKRDVYTGELKRKTLYVNVFIDDIPESMLGKLPALGSTEDTEYKYNLTFSETLLVETSPGKYQAHFKVAVVYAPDWTDEELEQEAKKLFKFFAYYYGGDVGSIDPYHLRKVPGFRNTKYGRYEKAPEITWEYVHGEDFNPKQVLKDFGEYISKENELNEYIIKPPEKKEEAQKRWIDFYHDMLETGSVDLSRVDMKYAVYLASRGYSDVEIATALVAESKDITMRKRGHLDDYITRTVKKAMKFATSPKIEYEEPKPQQGKEAQIEM